MSKFWQSLDRRAFLRGGLSSAIAVSLRAVVTGLPASFLLNGEVQAASSNKAKFTILSCSPAGEAINVNGPGTYGEGAASLIQHPKHAETGNSVSVTIGGKVYSGYDLENSKEISFGGQQVRLAQCYEALKPELLKNLVWFNHRTLTNAHPEFSSVLKLHGSLRGVDGRGSEMLPAAIAQETSKALDTTMSIPFVFNGNHLANGAPLNKYAPLTVKNLVNNSASLFGGADNFDKMYDFMIDEIYKHVKHEGTPKQVKFLDQHASSRQQAAGLGSQLNYLLKNINDNSPESELKAALAVFRLKLSPVAVVRHIFSGDNHNDSNLVNECKQTLNMIKSLNAYHTRSTDTDIDLENQVCFATMGVFGRTVRRNDKGGRNHLGQFTSGVIISPYTSGGVVGGIEVAGKNRNNIKSTGINSITGRPENADIDGNATLAAYMKTVMAASGISEARCDARIPYGKIVTSALSNYESV